MTKIILFIAGIMLCSSVYANEIDYSKIEMPVEIRGIWVDAGALPKTEAGIKQLVQNYKKIGINVLFPEVIARGYTVYCSKLIDRDPRFAGCIDPLPIMIKEAHLLGMEVHPWVWVFRAGYTKDRGAILTEHPDWVERGKNGEDLSPNGGLWISPSIPEARNFLACMYAELVKNYDIDGLHLDYIRYEVQSPTPYGYSEASRCSFLKQYGIDPINIDRLSQNQYEWQKFRERQINTFVQRIALQTRAIKPNVMISAAVGSDPTSARLNLLQNWANWIDNKWVDFVTPMAYTDKDESFRRLVCAQSAAVGFKALLAPGIGLHMQKNAPDQTVRQIGIARELGANGEVLFSSSHFTEGQQSAIACAPYAKQASLPFRDPECKSKILSAIAEQMSLSNCSNLSQYYTCRAQKLSDYAKYKKSIISYIPPTEPPLNIPDNIIALPGAEISSTTSAIVIDGKLDEAAWRDAASVKLAYTNDGLPASVETTALLTYDSNNLYIAFISSEPEISKIKATVTKRDGPTFYDDSVEVFVDPSGKRNEYYHLSTNTLGTRFDQKVLNPSWNGEWESVSSLGADSWTTEFAIPFKTLGVSSPSIGSTWAINLTRNRTIGGKIEYINWAVPYGSFHSPDRFGTITFK